MISQQWSPARRVAIASILALFLTAAAIAISSTSSAAPAAPSSGRFVDLPAKVQTAGQRIADNAHGGQQP